MFRNQYIKTHRRRKTKMKESLSKARKLKTELKNVKQRKAYKENKKARQEYARKYYKANAARILKQRKINRAKNAHKNKR